MCVFSTQTSKYRQRLEYGSYGAKVMQLEQRFQQWYKVISFLEGFYSLFVYFDSKSEPSNIKKQDRTSISAWLNGFYNKINVKLSSFVVSMFAELFERKESLVKLRAFLLLTIVPTHIAWNLQENTITLPRIHADFTSLLCSQNVLFIFLFGTRKETWLFKEWHTLNIFNAGISIFCM